MYSNDENLGTKGYVQRCNDFLRNKGKGALVGFGLLALTGCGSVKTVPEANVPSTQSYSMEKLEQNPTLQQEVIGDCVVSPDTYGNFMKNVLAERGENRSMEELSKNYESVDLNNVTKEDMAVGAPACLYFPKNVHVSRDLEQGSLENLVSNLSDEQIEKASEQQDHVSGKMYKQSGKGTYTVIPEGDHSLLQILDEGLNEKFQQKYGDFNVNEISTYDLKQDKNRLGTVTVYQMEGDKGTVIPKIDIYGNGYSVGGKYLSTEKINEHIGKRTTKESERREGDISPSDYRVSHETDSNGAMEARGISAALTGGAGILFHPAVGAGVFAANLFKNAEFDDVVSYNNYKDYKPGRSLSDILANEQDSSTTTIVSPVYGNNDQLSGFIKYEINPTNKNVVVGKDGIHVEESNKLLKAVAGDVLRLGAAAALYEIGRSEGTDKGDTIIKKEPDEPTGGVTRPDGSGPGVITR
ncbi:MAG: hypothetical protein ACOCQG_02530 [Candidatus Nanoarchaeia archaeon]